MTAEEIRKEFDSLYNMMASSNKVENMHTFGQVHKEMMDWFIQNKPELAQEWLGKLESIKWRNYLTPREAETIVAKMNPQAPWSRDKWKATLDSLGIVPEEEPYYNSCALWVVMNMEYSDSAQSIAKLMESPLEGIPAQQMVKAVHSFALDKLKDVDGVFSVRDYFKL